MHTSSTCQSERRWISWMSCFSRDIHAPRGMATFDMSGDSWLQDGTSLAGDQRAPPLLLLVLLQQRLEARVVAQGTVDRIESRRGKRNRWGLPMNGSWSGSYPAAKLLATGQVRG